MNVATLQAGNTLTFSAGDNDPTALHGRVAADCADPFGAITRLWPDLAEWIGPAPIVAQAYPSRLGAFPGTLLVDTYLRPTNVARALMVAAQRGATACLLAQPLVAAQLLIDVQSLGGARPQRLLLALGGYQCPPALERCLVTLAATADMQAQVLHAYGAAEVGAATLLGRRGATGEIDYHLGSDEVEADIGANRLLFLRHGRASVLTGDVAHRVGAAYRITPGPGRLAAEVATELEAWNETDWLRRTGHVRRCSSRLTLQLRPGLSPRCPDELEYFEFARRFGMSWLDKPRWT